MTKRPVTALVVNTNNQIVVIPSTSRVGVNIQEKPTRRGIKAPKLSRPAERDGDPRCPRFSAYIEHRPLCQMILLQCVSLAENYLCCCEQGESRTRRQKWGCWGDGRGSCSPYFLCSFELHRVKNRAEDRVLWPKYQQPYCECCPVKMGQKGPSQQNNERLLSSTLMRLNRAAGRGASAQPWLPGRAVFKPQCRTPQRLFPSQPRSSPLSDHCRSNGADRLLVTEPAPIWLSWLANR